MRVAERRYQVVIPEPVLAAAPILVLFHGWSSSAEKIARSSALPAAAAARGWIVIVPQGSGAPSRWAIPGRLTGPNDVAFVRRVIRDVASRCGADPTRVALAGFSNGAAFAAHLACRTPVVAVALVGGAGFGRPCAALRGTPMVFAHGEDDRVVRLAGGPVLGGRLLAWPFSTAVDRWRDAGASVEAITVPAWGHTWPPAATPAILEAFATVAV